MKKTLLQILALFLILCALLPLAACGGGGETSESRSESRSESTSDSASESSGVDWSNVYFDGEDLIVNVNVYQNIEQTFGAADVYSRGPDSLEGADEVGKLIYDRNLKLESDLGIYVIWEETDKSVGLNKEVMVILQQKHLSFIYLFHTMWLLYYLSVI